MRAGHQWTREEEVHLIAIGVEDFACETGIPYTAVKSRLEHLKRSRAKREQAGGTQWKVASERFAERDARAQARWRRDPAAELLGDPPPGYSALDRRNGGTGR